MPATWTDPSTQPWAANHIVTAAELNTHLRDLMLYLGGLTGRIACVAYNSATISIANNSLTAITFNSESLDTDPSGAMHSTSSNTSRVVAQTAGLYLCFGAGLWAANATGKRELQLRANGASTIAVDGRLNNGASYTVPQQVMGLVDLAATGYVELLAYQDSGGALDLTQASSYSPYLILVKV